jgi:hypothetical protein
MRGKLQSRLRGDASKRSQKKGTTKGPLKGKIKLNWIQRKGA